MKLINLVLILFVIILVGITGCDYIQQFREAPLGEEEEPLISIIPEEEITDETEEFEEELEEIEIIEPEGEEEKEEEKPVTKLEVNEGELVKLKLAATDPDGDPLTYTFSDPLNDKGEWQTKVGDAGEYKVKIIVDDGKTSTQQEILIVVKSTNRAPVLAPIGDKTINVDEELKFTLTASDPDGDDLTFSVEDLPKGADFDSEIATFSWTPKEGDGGKHQLTFIVSDGKLTDSEKITIDVNRPPVIESITLE